MTDKKYEELLKRYEELLKRVAVFVKYQHNCAKGTAGAAVTHQYVFQDLEACLPPPPPPPPSRGAIVGWLEEYEEWLKSPLGSDYEVSWKFSSDKLVAFAIEELRKEQ